MPLVCGVLIALETTLSSFSLLICKTVLQGCICHSKSRFPNHFYANFHLRGLTLTFLQSSWVIVKDMSANSDNENEPIYRGGMQEVWTREQDEDDDFLHGQEVK